MIQIATDIYMLEGLGGAPAYLLITGEALTLVDTGIIGQTNAILTQVDEAGYSSSDIGAIVLTHGHCDHAGNAAKLSTLSGAKICAHRDEIPYLKQEKPLPAASLLQRVVFWLTDHLWNTHITRVDVPLRDGDVVDALGGLRVLHIPGHTPGSIALYHPERRILFCGDSLTNREGIKTSPNLFTVDMAQAEESVRRLAELPVEIACFGHGDPILEQAGDRIREAVRH